MAVIESVYRAKGAAAKLFKTRAREVVLSGAAGTGKSRAIGEYLNWMCEEYPGIRVCVARKTLVSLRESWQVTFEEKVLWPNHPVLKGPSRQHRTGYDYPNGSRISLHGFDNVTRLFSTEYDVAYVQECTELTEDEWASLLRALRNGKLPWQQLLGDCNPDSSEHWLRKRMDRGMTTELVSKHADNPSLTPEYIKGLMDMPEPMRSRLYEGKWVQAEGAVLPDFQMARHGIDKAPDPLTIRWTFGSVDWGYTAPGVAIVFGVDAEKRLYRLAEIYRRNELLDWWCERIWELNKTHNCSAWVGDPARPDAIDAVNKRLGLSNRDGLMRAADNRRASSGPGDLSGIDLLKEGFAKDRIRLVRDVNTYVDEGLRNARLPWSSETELPGIVYLNTEGKPNREHIDPRVPDHAFDVWRYGASFAWGIDNYMPTKRVITHELPPGELEEMEFLGR